MAERVAAFCRVTITVEVTPTDTWGADCQIEQAHDQGAKSAIGLLQRFIEGSNGAIAFKRVERVDVVTFGRENARPQ